MVPDVLNISDYISTLPASLLAGFADQVDMFDLSFQAPPFTLAMARHLRNHTETGLEWLRELATGPPARPHDLDLWPCGWASRSHPLDHHCDSLPNADAHRAQRIAPSGAM
jgi:hypothetical protein